MDILMVTPFFLYSRGADIILTVIGKWQTHQGNPSWRQDY